MEEDMSVSWMPVTRFGRETDRYISQSHSYQADLHWDGRYWILRHSLMVFAKEIKLKSVKIDEAKQEAGNEIIKTLSQILEEIGYLQ